MSLQIIYSVVARNRKIILTDYTEYSGNFQQATLKILSKVEKNTKREIEYPPYTVLYEDIDDVTFILIGENLKTEVGFSFLSDVKKKFFANYDTNKIQNSFSYYLREFTSEIKPIVGKAEKIKKISINDILSQDEIIDIKSEKVQKTSDAWDGYKVTVNIIKKKKRAKMIKLGIMCILTFIIAFGVVYLLLN